MLCIGMPFDASPIVKKGGALKRGAAGPRAIGLSGKPTAIRGIRVSAT